MIEDINKIFIDLGYSEDKAKFLSSIIKYFKLYDVNGDWEKHKELPEFKQNPIRKLLEYVNIKDLSDINIIVWSYKDIVNNENILLNLTDNDSYASGLDINTFTYKIAFFTWLRKIEQFFEDIIDEFYTSDSVEYLMKIFYKISEIDKPYIVFNDLLSYCDDLNVMSEFIEDSFIPLCEKIGFYQYYPKANKIIILDIKWLFIGFSRIEDLKQVNQNTTYKKREIRGILKNEQKIIFEKFISFERFKSGNNEKLYQNLKKIIEQILDSNFIKDRETVTELDKIVSKIDSNQEVELKTIQAAKKRIGNIKSINSLAHEYDSVVDELMLISISKNLAFEDTKSSEYVFPNLINNKSYYDWENYRDKINLIYVVKYYDNPYGVVNSFFASYKPQKNIKKYWNNEVLINDNSINIWLKDFTNEKKVEIYISLINNSNELSETIGIITNELKRTSNDNIISRRVICYCKKCKQTWLNENAKDLLAVTSFDLNQLKLWKLQNITIRCNFSQQNLIINKLLGYESIELNEMENSNLTKRKKIFIAYSRTLKEHAERLNHLLQIFVQNQKILTFYDKNIDLGSRWNETIIKELKQSDIFIFLVNNDAFTSWYINEVELKIALEKDDRGGKVIPIFIENSQREETPFGNIQGFPREGFYDELIEKVGKNNAENFLLNEIKQYF